VVSFTPQPHYPWDMSPRYPLGRRLGGLRSLSGHGETSHHCPWWELIPGRPAHSLVSVLSYPSLRSILTISYLWLGLPSGLLRPGFQINILYAFLISPCPAHVILLHLVTLLKKLPVMQLCQFF